MASSSNGSRNPGDHTSADHYLGDKQFENPGDNKFLDKKR